MQYISLVQKGKYANTHEGGDGRKKSPVLKTAPIELIGSVQGSIGVGMTNKAINVME